jgi:hypothetical protein
MRRLSLLVPIATIVVFALASAASAFRPASPRVELRPAVVRLNGHATIAVSGMHTRSLQVLLAGATDTSGTRPAKQLPWQSLRLVNGNWVGTLPAPALRGVYPIVLRTGAGAAPLESQGLLLRVFATGTSSQPSFRDPVDVVRWWVRTVPQASIVTLKAWPRPDFDRRDGRLHRLFVVAYSPSGDAQNQDQLGMFITAFRDSFNGRWRLLEATVQP